MCVTAALDDLERQGFDMSNKTNPWIQKLETDLQNKATFDVHSTNPQADTQPTWSCEFWIRYVDLVWCMPKPTTEQPSTPIHHLLYSLKSAHQE